MNGKSVLHLVAIVFLCLFLGGCMEMNQDKTNQNEYEKENYVPIQAYTGEGYQLDGANEEILEIAENHEDDITNAVKQFLLDKYKVDVEVHNMVGAKDGVTVFVESKDEPKFHTFVIVPVNEKEEQVMLDYIWSQEGEVERAIKGGLYVMAFQEEFHNLDIYLQKMTEEFPIIGTPDIVIDNVKANGYTTPYYFLSPAGDVFKDLYEVYTAHPDMDKKDIQAFFHEQMPEARYIKIAIEFYMEETDIPPKQDILDTIAADLEKMEDIPRGAYSIYLNDNYIDKSRGIGKKENTLERKTPNEIVKE